MKRFTRTCSILLIASFMVLGQQHDLVANQTDDVDKLKNLLAKVSSSSDGERQASQLEFEQICLALTAPGRESDRESAGRLIAKQVKKPTDSAANSASTKLFLLRQLERIGGAESVSVLTQLLKSDDPHVQDGARRALRANPDPTAGAALLEALDATTDAQLRVGIINSLGERANADSVPALAEQLVSDDSKTFRASLNSLVRIGTPSAVKEIQLAHEKVRSENRQYTADARLRCADRVAQSGDEQAAHDMYVEIGKTVEDSPVRLAALRGQLMTAGKRAPELILSILAADDQRARQVAVGFVADMPASGISDLLAGLDRLPSEAQVRLITSLGNRRATVAIGTVRKCLESDDPNIRKAALTAIGSIGYVEDAQRLLHVMQSNPDERSVAAKSLAAIRDDRVDPVLIELLANAKTDEDRLDFIGILNQRRATAAVEELMKQAVSRNKDVRKRAVGALSRLGSEGDVAALLDVHGVTAREERDSIEKAIVSVCRRIPSEDGKSDPLIAQYEGADIATRVRIIQVLGRVGGRNAQQSIDRALASKDADLYDAAVVAFANWPDGSVAEPLLQVAREGQTEAQRLRALRSLARVCVLPTPERPDLERLEFLKQAMQLATRKEEVGLVIDRAKAVRLVETLRFVAPYLDDSDHRDQAVKTVLALAHHRDLREPNRAEFAPALQKVIQTTKDPKLVERAKKYLQNR